jgi:nucleotide-binding universal stress UspA family protein
VFRRTIVAFDGSDRAHDALALALRLRDPDDGELTLACAITERPWRPGRSRHGSVAVSDEIALMLAAARAKIPTGIRVALRVPAAGSPARALTELAEDEGADLLVVGSSRRSSPGRIWLERTAGRLLQGAPCAVAVAPANARETDTFHHIGVAFDGSPEATSALAAGYVLAARTGAAVTLFHALTDVPPVGAAMVGADPEHEAMRERLHAQEMLDGAADAAPAGVNPRTVLLHGVPGKVIADACEGIVDLLVTGSRGYGPLQRALMGSVAEALMEGATHPVLVLPRASADTAADREHAHVGVEA